MIFGVYLRNDMKARGTKIIIICEVKSSDATDANPQGR